MIKEIDEVLKEINNNLEDCPKCRGEGYNLTKDEKLVEECKLCNGKGSKVR